MSTRQISDVTLRTDYLRMGRAAKTWLTQEDILTAMREVEDGGYQGLNELLAELLKDYLAEKAAGMKA